MECSCTVFFENPFWVLVVERRDETGCSAARFVLGAEPSDAELLAFALHRYADLQFCVPVALPLLIGQPAGSFKRRLREARRQMEQRGPGTRAQQALQAAYEQNRQERRVVSRVEREAEEERRFQLRQERRREKHQGH